MDRVKRRSLAAICRLICVHCKQLVHFCPCSAQRETKDKRRHACNIKTFSFSQADVKRKKKAMASAASSKVNVRREQQLRSAATLNTRLPTARDYELRAKNALLIAYFNAAKKPEFANFLNNKILPKMGFARYVFVPGIWQLNTATGQFQAGNVQSTHFTVFMMTPKGLKIEYVVPTNNAQVAVKLNPDFYVYSVQSGKWVFQGSKVDQTDLIYPTSFPKWSDAITWLTGQQRFGGFEPHVDMSITLHPDDRVLTNQGPVDDVLTPWTLTALNAIGDVLAQDYADADQHLIENEKRQLEEQERELRLQAQARADQENQWKQQQLLDAQRRLEAERLADEQRKRRAQLTRTSSRWQALPQPVAAVAAPAVAAAAAPQQQARVVYQPFQPLAQPSANAAEFLPRQMQAQVQQQFGQNQFARGQQLYREPIQYEQLPAPAQQQVYDIVPDLQQQQLYDQVPPNMIQPFYDQVPSTDYNQQQ